MIAIHLCLFIAFSVYWQLAISQSPKARKLSTIIGENVQRQFCKLAIVMTEKLELTSQATVRRETIVALAALFAVLVLIAFLPILVKFSESEISPNATLFNPRSISAVVLVLWNGLSLINRRCHGNQLPVKQLSNILNLLPLLVIMTTFSVGHSLLYFWSLTQTSIANSEVLHSLNPIFITWVEMLLGKTMGGGYIIGITLTICGSIGIVFNDFTITIDKFNGDVLALFSAIFLSGYLLVLEKIQPHLSANAITTCNYLISTVFLLPIILVDGDNIFPNSWQIWLIVTAMSTIGIFAKFLITYSLKRLSSGLVATIFMLHPAITAILAWVIFSESLSILNLLAFVVILFGVYLGISSKGGVKTTEE